VLYFTGYSGTTIPLVCSFPKEIDPPELRKLHNVEEIIPVAVRFKILNRSNSGIAGLTAALAYDIAIGDS
jgi:hypothetical protein